MLSDKRDASNDEESMLDFAKPTRRDSWTRALVLDPESGCVDIQKESAINKSKHATLLQEGRLTKCCASRIPGTETEEGAKEDIDLHRGQANRS